MSLTKMAATAVIKVSTVDMSAAVNAAMIRPKRPGWLRKSEAMKNAAFAEMSGGKAPACTRAFATQPPDATTRAAIGISTTAVITRARRPSFTDRADKSRMASPWFRNTNMAVLAMPSCQKSPTLL